MLESKRKRQPTRSAQERIEDVFMDASIDEQAAMLAAFQALHRMKRRFLDKAGEAVEESLQGSLIDRSEPGHKYIPNGRGLCNTCGQPEDNRTQHPEPAEWTKP